MVHVQAAMCMLPQYVHWDFVTTMYACFLYMEWIYIIDTNVDMGCFRNKSESLYIRSCIALVKFSSCLRLNKSFWIGRMKTRPLPVTLFSSLGDWAMAADIGSKDVLRPCGWHLSSTNLPQSSSLGKVAIIAGLKSWREHDMSSMVTFLSPRPASTSISFSAEDNGTLVSAKLL